MSLSAAANRRQLRRKKTDRLLRLCCRLAMFATFCSFAVPAVVIIRSALPSCTRAEVTLPIYFDASLLAEKSAAADFSALLRRSLAALSVQTKGGQTTCDVEQIFAPEARAKLQRVVREDRQLIGTTAEISLPVSHHLDRADSTETAAESSPQQLDCYRRLQDDGRVHRRLNLGVFSIADTRSPEPGGIGRALLASLQVMLFTLLLSLPTAIGTALYLEEIAPQGRGKRILELTLRNHTALPPVLYGLAGLSLFVHIFKLPGGSLVVAALVLSLLTIPPMIFTARTALAAVPAAMKEAALSLGATRSQTIFHHVLPAALPAIVATSLGQIGRAFGECAPLLLLGLVVFSGGGGGEPVAAARAAESTPLLPVQIFLWAQKQESVPEAALAILVLILIPAGLHLPVLILRKRRRQKEKNSFAAAALYLSEEKR